MTRLESRLFAQSFVVGIICTLIVVTAQAIGLLSPLDRWLYDKRAAYAQFATPAPSKQIAHLDIDDASMEAIGRWPWPRSTLARILDEVHLAKPAAVGLDIRFPEPAPVRLVRDHDGSIEEIDDDAQLAQAFRQSGAIVLANDFNVKAEEQSWPMLARTVELFENDLELPRAKFPEELGPTSQAMGPGLLDSLFLHGRRLAMRQRIDQALAAGNIQLPELLQRLLPHTDPNIDSPLTRLLSQQYVIATAAMAVPRFGAPALAMVPPPLPGTLDEVPLARFSEVVAGCGFANYDIFDDATLRSIPLFVQYQKKLYPQFGLAVACVAMGGDPKKVQFDGANVIIPTPSGPIVIPTYTYYSKSLRRDVPLIAAIPWFGTSDWKTMYDWPTHRESTGHISIINVWDLCLIQDIISRTNGGIDTALSHLLNNDRPDELEVDPDLAKHFISAHLDPLDIDSREARVQKALAALKETGWMESYDAMADKDMTAEDRLRRDQLHDAVNALTAGIAKNHESRQLLQKQRGQLATELGGKAIFVGFIGGGLEDKVTTSLHQVCPGVVVHGAIADAVLKSFWWRVAPGWVGLAFTLMLGIATAFGQGRLPPLRAGLFAVGLAAIYSILNWGVLFALERLNVAMAGPMVVIVVVWGVCTLLRVIVEGVERIRIATENEIFAKEMSLARKVQFALVPEKAPEMSGINADGWTLPADMTGGDLFDLWTLPDGRLGILVADASGHGLAPAMIVSQVRTLVHMLSEYEAHPHDLLRRVNTRLSRDLETGRFVTAFLAFLSSNGEFEWASAGHGPMYWCPTGEGELLELDSSGLPLGVQEDWLADDPSPPLKMELTGRLIVFSDGIFEAHALDPKAGLFGTDAIKDILQNACHATSTEIIHSIREAVQKFQGKKEPVDDQTIVVVRRVPAEEAKPDDAAAENGSIEVTTSVSVAAASIGDA
jgi:CHASE2 domain-containing sensor protein